MDHRRKGSFRMREFRVFFAGIFAGLLFLEALVVFISIRERGLLEDTISDQSLLLQAREAVRKEVEGFAKLSELALKAATTGDRGHAKMHEDLVSALAKQDSVKMGAQLSVRSVPGLLAQLKGGDTTFRSDDFSILSQAIENAETLLQSDRQALHAVRGMFPDASGTFNVRGNGNPELLLALLDDKESAGKRQDVLDGFNGFLAALDVRIYASVKENTSTVREYSTLVLYLTGVLLLATVGGGILLYRNINEPLRSFRIHSRKIKDDLARTIAELHAVSAERDALLRGERNDAPQHGAVDPASEPIDALHRMP